MPESNGTTIPKDDSTTLPSAEAVGKGKGKAVDPTPVQDMSMEEEDDSSEEESGPEEAVRAESISPLPSNLSHLIEMLIQSTSGRRRYFAII